MTKGRDNLAGTLNEVLEAVRLRRQTGLLSIECPREGRYEEGEVYVQAGQPVYAQTGQLGGQEALLRMLGWRQIQFAFLPDVARSAAQSSSTERTNRSAASSPVGTLTTPHFPAVNGSGFSQAVEQKSEPLPAQNATQVQVSTPGLEWLIPHKVGAERDVMGLPLTRPQRSVYLLVDGRRSVSDLARCTRKSIQEIDRLLSELRERGLITI